jgi:ribosome-binding factor A
MQLTLMGNRRTARVAEAIREVVSTTILFELRDPRITNVTVLSVEVPGDLRSARVHVSVMGEDKVVRLSMAGLTAARGFIQSRIADRLDLQYTPVLSFVLDDGIKKSIEAARILQELAEQRGAADAAESSAADPPARDAAHIRDADETAVVEPDTDKTDADNQTTAEN